MADVTREPPAPDEEDLAEQRRMANDYSETFTGPLVGKKAATELIHDEYASSDPAFVAKTKNLPQDFPLWRKLRGDGSCGLRAIAFAYFELLASLNEPHVWTREKARLAELNGLLRRSEYDETIWEDWVEQTESLFDDLAKTATTEAALGVIEETFNDPGSSIAILTHLRFLISHWLKEEGQRYEPYLLDMSVEEYRKSLEVTHSELDEISIRAAYDMLLDGPAIALEVSYLDRSHGEKVTPHIYEPSDQSRRPIGTIHFLYRPGHFDLLYPKHGG